MAIKSTLGMFMLVAAAGAIGGSTGTMAKAEIVPIYSGGDLMQLIGQSPNYASYKSNLEFHINASTVPIDKKALLVAYQNVDMGNGQTGKALIGYMQNNPTAPPWISKSALSGIINMQGDGWTYGLTPGAIFTDGNLDGNGNFDGGFFGAYDHNEDSLLFLIDTDYGIIHFPEPYEHYPLISFQGMSPCPETGSGTIQSSTISRVIIPEPSTAAVLGVGALALCSKKKKTRFSSCKKRHGISSINASSAAA